MIHIVFSGTTHASVGLAKIADKNQILHMEFMLDIGELKLGVDSDYRKDLFTRMYWYANPEMKSKNKRMDSYYEWYLRDLKSLINFAKKGQEITIWQDKTPSGMCQFYFLCHEIYDISPECNVYVMELPTYYNYPGGVSLSNSWGAFEYNEIASIGYRRKLPSEEIVRISEKWLELVNENAPLRSVVAGKIVSVRENFYDEIFLKFVEYEENEENYFEERFMGWNEMGIDYLLFQWRMEELIKKGKIIVNDDLGKFKRIKKFKGQ